MAEILVDAFKLGFHILEKHLEGLISELGFN